MDTTFNAVSPTVGSLSYTAAQIRSAYGINNIPSFGTAAADGSGQTIAIVDAYNDPNILTDLDGFDQAMSLSTNSTQTLYQQYGPASSILTVYNQTGANITNSIGNSGSGGVPAADPTGAWEGEETMDVEWAHAIAPGAHIDLIECDGSSASFDGLFDGAATAAQLPGVSVVSMSWIFNEGNWSSSNGSGELAYDSSTFVTPSGHTGVTFLGSSGDSGTPSGYPAFSPQVVAVGATELSLDNDAYGSETAWSFPTPRTIDNGSSSYSQTGSWTTQSGGFSGSYSTAPAGSDSSATWRTPLSSADKGWVGGVEVTTTWTPNPSNATNAVYQIYDGAAASGTLLGTVMVDQTQAPIGTSDGNTKFQMLGNYYPQSGTLTVVLSANTANGSVVADAVGVAPAWASGGGQSRYESEPSWQLPFQNTGQRTSPDVAFDGSIASGVTCYQNGGLRFGSFGTSLSAPCWAGMIAIANQGRVALGASTLNSAANPEQTLQALYSLPAGDFHDIPSGYNGFGAQAGYDFLTGRGSPIANRLIPDLVRYGFPTVTAISPSSGPDVGGTNVMITGTNFTPASTVSFGSVAATSVTVHSATSITAVTPKESAGTVDVTVITADGTSATSNADKFTYTLTAGPVITIQPSSQTVTAGETATFTAAASGTPSPTVQWQVSANRGQTFTNLSGATSTTLTLNNVQSLQNGYEYQAVFTNSTDSATTSAAILAVQFPPTVTTDPSDQTVVEGQTATFTAAADANPSPTVQWQVSSDNGQTWTPLSGAISTTLTLNNVQSSQGGYEYEAIFTNSIGSTTTTAAILTVQTAPTVTTNPSDQIVTAGRSATFTAAVYGNPSPTVQWQASPDGGMSWADISGATSPTLTLSNVQFSQNGNEYQAVFANSVGSATTTAATLTVQTAPAVTTNPSDQTVTAGQTATFTAAADGNPMPSVQWQVSTDGGTTWTDISVATSTTLTLSNVLLAQMGRKYHAVFTNSLGTATTTAATLTVQTAPAFTSVNTIAFAIGQGGSFTVTATGSPTPVLTESGVLPSGMTFMANGNGTAVLAGAPAAGTQGNYYFTIMADNGVGSHVTQNLMLTVNPAPMPPLPPQPPSLQVPPLLALINGFLKGAETVNADGTETITYSLFGFTLIEAIYDRSGNFVSGTLFGFIIPNRVWFM